MFQPERHKVDLTTCDKEPIHIPGRIQQHGFLLAVEEIEAIKETNFKIVQLSDNIKSYLGIDPQSVIGENLGMAIGQGPYDYIKKQLKTNGSLRELNPLSLTLECNEKKETYILFLYRSGGLLVLEFEPAIFNPENNSKSIQNLYLAKNLSDLYEVLVTEVKKITGYDRVMIYQFEHGHGSVIAESKEPHMEPYLGLHYPGSDIPKQAMKLFLNNRIRVIIDVDHQLSVIVPEINPIINEPLDLTYSLLRGVSPIHIQYLRNMGVKASMTISLIIKDELWGLITCHHDTPKKIPHGVRILCELLGQIASSQISELQTKAEENSKNAQRKKLNFIYERTSLDDKWYAILNNNIDILLNLVKADGLAICYEGQYGFFGKTPSKHETIKIFSYIVSRTSKSERVFSSNSLTNMYREAETYKEIASGALVSILSPAENDFIIWFRQEITQTINWAGKPHKAVEIEQGTARLTPRQSFAVWQEEVKFHSLPWSKAEIDVVNQLTKSLLDIKLKNYHESNEKHHEDRRLFIDRLCHELRNPLNAIVGCSDLIQDLTDEILKKIQPGQKLDDEKIKSIIKNLQEIGNYIKNINESSSLAVNVTNGVLELSKLEQKKVKIELVTCELRKVTQTVINMFEASIRKKGLLMKVNLPREEIWVESEPNRVMQILVNLLSNAIKFTQKGHILIFLNVSSNDNGTVDECEVVVKDTGRGITQDEQTRLFQRFEQANSKIALEYGGSGLGLLISRELSQLLGGDICVDSEIGKGSAFKFTFKAKRSTQTQIDAYNFQNQLHFNNQRNVLNNNTHNALRSKILIVDDNATNRMILNKNLSSENYRCEDAEDGKIAVEKYKQYRYKIIFMDIQMPNMDGKEATQLIREYESKNNIKPAYIIGLSANIDDKFKKEATNSGMNIYMTKPAKKVGIINRVNEFFENNEMTDPEKKILIVEDNPVNQIALRAILTKQGYNCDIAENGEIAINKYRHFAYKTIFMDISMPIMNGYKATVKIREIEKEKNIQPAYIICLSASLEDSYKERALHSGMNIFVEKPFKPQNILHLLESIQDNPQEITYLTKNLKLMNN